VQDRYGLFITAAGGGASPREFGREDGMTVAFPAALDEDTARAKALAVFDAHAPASYVPPIDPDPAGFVLALWSDPSIPIGTRNALVPWKTAIADHLDRPDLIAAAWAELCATLPIRSVDQDTIHGHAARYGIPGI
jgi:hypothetical protein